MSKLASNDSIFLVFKKNVKIYRESMFFICVLFLFTTDFWKKKIEFLKPLFISIS